MRRLIARSVKHITEPWIPPALEELELQGIVRRQASVLGCDSKNEMVIKFPGFRRR